MSTQSGDYRSVKAISNSLMGVYEDDFDGFADYWVRNIPLKQKSDEALSMGSAIDTLLTRPDEFGSIFAVYKGAVPSGQMLSFCQILASKYKSDIDIATFYQAAYDEVGFKRDSLKKVEEKFDECKTFFNYLINSRDKCVLTSEQVKRANEIVDELKGGKYTSGPVNIQPIPGFVDVYNQLELYYKYDEIPIKGALDRVIVNHMSKKVIPIDFKSSYNSDDFENSYIKWKYYRQASFYKFLLQKWMEENNLTDYELTNFMFIVCSKNGGRHFSYIASETDIHAARVGGSFRNGRIVKGWEELLMEIGYLTELADWSYPYEVIRNNGIVPLNVFN